MVLPDSPTTIEEGVLLDSTARGSPVPKPAKLIAGILLLGSLTVMGLAALIRWRPPGEIGPVLDGISPGVLLLLSVLLMLDFVLGGVRYRIFFNGRIFPKIPLWHCIRANWATAFLGAVTPAQTGGGPAQLFVLCRRGALLSQALLVSAMNLVATLLFFSLGGLIVLILIPPEMLSRIGVGVLGTALVGICLLAGFVIAAIVLQSETIKLLERFVTKMTWRSQRARRWGVVVRSVIARERDQLRQGVMSVGARGKKALGFVAMATVVLYLNKYAMGFVLAVALQGSVEIWIIGLQLLQNVVLYFAPTPGASGFAEASTGILLKQVLAAEITVLWVVLWRLLTTFFGAILGMFVLIGEVRRHVKNRNGTKEGQAA